MLRQFFLLGLALLVPTLTQAQPTAWRSDFHPYRLELTLAQQTTGRVAIELDASQVVDALQPIALEEMRLETLALDRLVLIDPSNGTTVGRFELVEIEPLPIDGDFRKLQSGDASPWRGFDDASMKWEQRDAASKALVIRKNAIANTKLAQAQKLNVGAFYLLEWNVWSDAEDNSIDVNLYDPSRWYFANVPGSYVPILPPRKQWTKNRSLKLANVEHLELRIGTAFIGTCKVADLSLKKVAWRLIADLPRATDRLDLYCVALGGHRMASPPEALAAMPSTRVNVSRVNAQLSDLNPQGVRVDGHVISAWSVPSSIPLDPARLRQIRPLKSSPAPLVVRVTPGQSSTIPLVLDSGTSHLQVLDAKCDLPITAQFERVGEVPLTNGPHPDNRPVGGRFDARFPLDDPHVPPSDSELHVVSVTFTASSEEKPAVHRGVIQLKVRNPVPREETISLPIELRVLPATLKPMRHFGAVISSVHLDMRYTGEGYIWPGASVGDFHGMKTGTPTLHQKYQKALIEHGLIPQHLLSRNITCEVVDAGKDKAPELSGWDFTGLDHAIDEYVLKQDLPWLMIHHTNGEVMASHRLSNGVTYTIKPADNQPNVVQLPEEEYFKLIARYFEAIGRHLEQRGVLDRAMVVIDESSHETYPTIYRYTQAVRSTPQGARIKFAHTAYKTSTFTQRLPDGSLILDQALDIPMPDNDEEFNFFEPEFNARFTQRPKRNWVYYVETTHFSLDYAGLSTLITPLKLGHFGAAGWYCWASVVWSCPWAYDTEVGPRWKVGPLVNPFLNSFYHHGPAAISLFYPPDPRGLSPQPTETIVPSHRLALMRQGFATRALLEVLRAGKDDSGAPINVDPARLQSAEDLLKQLYTAHPTQWYLSYRTWDRATDDLYDALEISSSAN